MANPFSRFFRKQSFKSLNGAYRFDDGPLVSIRPSTKGTLRARIFETGETRQLHPDGLGGFVSGPGFAAASPVDLRVSFRPDGSASGPEMDWVFRGGPVRTASRAAITRQVAFSRDGIRFSGRLDLPPGPGPHPAVVLVHGSGKDAATEYFYTADFFAAHGIVALTFDKRGTGQSGGKFTMDFRVLAGDVAAAVESLKAIPEIDPGRIGLTGYSQGGWVAPLAASMCPDVRYVIVNYGMLESSSVEALLETLILVRSRGITSEADLADVSAVTEATVRIVASNFRDGWEEFRRLKARYAGAHWLPALKGSPVSQFFRLPPWLIRLVGPRLNPPGLDWNYDSGTLLSGMDLPMQWLLGASDVGAPNERTIPRLQAFIDAGKPYELVVFEGADHGILLFDEVDGTRRYTRYAPGYFIAEVAFALRQSGLQPVDSWPGSSFLGNEK